MTSNDKNKRLEELYVSFEADLKDTLKLNTKTRKITCYASDGNPGFRGVNIDIEHLSRGISGYRLVVGVDQIESEKLNQTHQKLLMEKCGLIKHRSVDLRAEGLNKNQVHDKFKQLIELIEDEKISLEKKASPRKERSKKSGGAQSKKTQVVNSESDKWTLEKILSCKERLGVPDPPNQQDIDDENYALYCSDYKRYQSKRWSFKTAQRRRWAKNKLNLFVIGITRAAADKLAAEDKEAKGLERAHLFSCKEFAHKILESHELLSRENFLKWWWYANVTIIGLREENALLEFEKSLESLSVTLIKNEILPPAPQQIDPFYVPRYFKDSDSGLNKSDKDLEMVRSLRERNHNGL